MEPFNNKVTDEGRLLYNVWPINASHNIWDTLHNFVRVFKRFQAGNTALLFIR